MRRLLGVSRSSYYDYEQHRRNRRDDWYHCCAGYAKPDQVHVCDITCIWSQEGWLYLAVVIDLFSRKVVDWSSGCGGYCRVL